MALLFSYKNPNEEKLPRCAIDATKSNREDYVPSMNRKQHQKPEVLKNSTMEVGYIPQPLVAKAKTDRYCSINFPHESEIQKNNPGILGYIAPPVPSLVSSGRMIESTDQWPTCSLDFIMPPKPVKKTLKPIVRKNLKEISFLEQELNTRLKKGISTDNLVALRLLRWKLQLRYENIILADTRYCAENEVEQKLWRSAYYQIIESLREDLKREPANKEIRENILCLVHEGDVFYETLLEKLQQTSGFNLTQLLKLDNHNGSFFSQSLRLFMISSQKIVICLGDLARYKQQASGDLNFSKARNLYLEAHRIDPKNGLPYHQLAILGLKRKLDAAYYFIRNLTASNPFLSSREYLPNLFEAAKKSYECYEKERLATECKNVSTVELNKRFVNSFLHIHGKLYTKVGMETFDDTFVQMLKEFYHLLQRDPLNREVPRLLQLSSINMYAVANILSRDSNYGERYPTLLIQALQVNQAMMSLLIQRCCNLQKLHMASHDYPKQLVSFEVGQLLPVIKVWTDWMLCRQNLWPQLSSLPSALPDIGLKLDVWSSFAQFLSVLMEMDISQPEIADEGKEGFEPFILEEDTVMSDFGPLLGAFQNPAYTMPQVDKDKAKQCLRINRIKYFGEYLSGIPKPYLKFNVERKKFISLVATFSGERTQKDFLKNH